MKICTKVEVSSDESIKIIKHYKNDVLFKVDRLFNGKITGTKFYDKDGNYENGNRPAVISYHDNGNIRALDWYYKRENNYPCGITYYENNLVHSFIWYDDKDAEHRDNGPSLILYNKDGTIRKIQYQIHGELHRVYGPTVIDYDYNYVNYKFLWHFKGEKYTEEVNQWIQNNNFNSWEGMTESDFDRMWIEIL